MVVAVASGVGYLVIAYLVGCVLEWVTRKSFLFYLKWSDRIISMGSRGKENFAPQTDQDQGL